MNKTLSALTYFALWLVLVITQTLLISTSQSAPSVWAQTDYYYSTWVVDIYLILLFYLNYYVLAPGMISRRLFTPYAIAVGVSALIGFLVPIALYASLGWGMPGVPTGEVPISSLGALGAICAMSFGLAGRGLVQWMRLQDVVTEQSKALEELEPLRKQVEELQGREAELMRRADELVSALELAEAKASPLPSLDEAEATMP